MEAKIKDSGERAEFSTGAVRDIQKGKGRCDLMPLDVVAVYLADDNGREDKVLDCIYRFQQTGTGTFLLDALLDFCSKRDWDSKTMLLEVSKHFEEGAEKYGENNWQKGLPVSCYINSAVRHYLKWLRGDKDEHHDRAFCWNILCCAWTVRHKPEVAEV